MGTWGTGLYSNDVAQEVRDACKDIFAVYDVDAGNRLLLEQFKDLFDSAGVDNDGASFWYALADWQWNHGMLTEAVKNKAEVLLAQYAGIEDWEESGQTRDVIKRKAVLDALKEKLKQQQPDYKKPKLRLSKPKHKPGDIVIFKSCEEGEDHSWDHWLIDSYTPPFMFRSSTIAKSGDTPVLPYNGYGNYFALLCVGSEKECHSCYVGDQFDEYSTYVWYDYSSKTMPNINTLQSCGFLPLVLWHMKDFNKKITESIHWTYRFTLAAEDFKTDPASIVYYNAAFSEKEVTRYHSLLEAKEYASDYFGGLDILHMFGAVFAEKIRMESLGIPIDNLLDPVIKNPLFLTPAEIDVAYKKYFEHLR